MTGVQTCALPICFPVTILRDLYRELIAFRKKSPALTSGEVVWLENNSDSAVLSFLRKAPGEELLVVINLSNRPLLVALPGVDLKKFRQVEFSGNPRKPAGPSPEIPLRGFGWVICKKHTGEG